MKLNDKKIIVLIIIIFIIIITISILDSLRREREEKNNTNNSNTIESSSNKAKDKTILDKDNKSFKIIDEALNMDDETLKKKENELSKKANNLKIQRVQKFKENYVKVINGEDIKIIEEYISKNLLKKILLEKKDNKTNKVKLKIIKINLEKIQGNPEIQEYLTNEELEIDTNGKKELKKLKYKYKFNTLEQVFEQIDLIKEGE